MPHKDGGRAQDVAGTEGPKWDGIFEALKDGVLLLDSEGKVLQCNTSMSKLLGKPAEEIVGSRCCELLHGLKTRAPSCPALRMRQSGHTESLVLSIRGRWFEVTAYPEFDGQGRIVGAIHIMSDVTPKEVAAEALAREAEVSGDMADLSGELMGERSAEDISRLVLEHAGRLTRSSFGFIVYLSPQTGAPLVYRGSGKARDVEEGQGLANGGNDLAEIWGAVYRNPQPLLLNRAEDVRPLMGSAGPPVPISRLISIPVMINGAVVGQLVLANANREYTPWDLSLGERLATLYGISMNRRLAVEALERSLEDLKKALDGTVNALASLAERRDPYTAGHQRRVAQLACAIAAEMKLPKEKIEGLGVAGVLHDIGKIYVPAEILSKPTRLLDIERSLIKNHVEVSHEVLKEIEFPWPVAEIVLQHHERMDGSGYPRGLKGDQILIEARILAVADVVEAMASHRPYRPAWGLDKALLEILQNRGTQFDPDVVDVCMELFQMKDFKFG